MSPHFVSTHSIARSAIGAAGVAIGVAFVLMLRAAAIAGAERTEAAYAESTARLAATTAGVRLAASALGSPDLAAPAACAPPRAHRQR